MQFIKKNSIVIILVGILLIASFLRLYTLSEIPNGLYVDEAEIGYNAYSILQTGKDEFGKSFPLFIRSFNVYAPPLYMYLTTIPIYLFGLSIFSARFVSAISGVITTFLIYFIFKKISPKKYFPLLGAFLFAISPWSIFFSRGAFEANFALCILSFAIYFLVYAKERPRYFLYSFLFLSLSTYCYHAERLLAYLIIALTLFVFFILNRNEKKPDKKDIITSLVLFGITQLPLLFLANTYAFKSRAFGIFYFDAINSQASKIIFFPESITKVLAFGREFLANYSSYYSPKNLFLLGDADLQRSIPGLSVFYPWMVIPYFVGAFMFIKEWKKNKGWWVMLLLFIIAPIPAALAKDPFSSLRALPLIIPMIFIITLGIEKIATILHVKLFIIISIVALGFSALSLWRSYFVLFPQERAVNWDYGFIELSKIIDAHPNQQYLIDQSRINPAYILLSFHMQIPPTKIQAASDQTIKGDYYNRSDVNFDYSIKNFTTRSINWEEDIYKDQILVGDRYAISDGQIKEHYLEKVFEIDNPLHEPLFIGYHTSPQAKCKSIANSNSHCTIE